MADQRSLLEKNQQRRVAFKGKRSRWKEMLRQRCVQRIKNVRMEQMAQRRGMEDTSVVEDVMKQEFSMFMTTPPSSQAALPSTSSQPDCARSLPMVDCSTRSDEAMEVGGVLDDEPVDIVGDGEDEELLLAIWHDLSQELKAEERRMLDDMARQLAEHEARADAASVEASLQAAQQDPVFCPICKRRQLLQNKCVIFCECGFRFDSRQDCVSLHEFARYLQAAFAQHGTSVPCVAEPQFQMQHQPNMGVSLLTLSCTQCGFFEFF